MPATAAPALPVKVLADLPDRFVLEIGLPEPMLAPDKEGAVSIQCGGCQGTGRPGSPDLPVHRFQVAAGEAEPRVVLHVLESETRTLPQGVRPYPRYVTNRSAVYERDAAAYRQAASPAPRVSPPRYLRGVRTRTVEVPLALWDEGGRTLTLLRRVKAEVILPGPLSRAGTWPAHHFRGLANPQGARFHHAPPRRGRTLAKAAGVRGAVAGPRNLGASWLRIKIGDRSVGGQDEDRVYAAAYEDLAKAGNIAGIPIGNLRLYAGPNDTLPRAMGRVVSDGNLRQIAIEVVDGGLAGTFDEGDTLRFYGHGTSIWKRAAADSGAIHWEHSIDPYSFENFYFLAWDTDDPAARLVTEPGLAPTGAPRETGYHYLRAERDLLTASCDPSSRKDEETGFVWFWFWKGRCDTYLDTTITLSKGQLVTPETEILADWVRGDTASVYLGTYTYPASVDTVSFRIYWGGARDTLTPLKSHSAQGTFYRRAGPHSGGEALPLDSIVWAGREKRFEGYTLAYLRRHAWRGKPLWIFPHRFGERVTYRVAGGAGLLCLRIEQGEVGKRLRLDALGDFTDSVGAASDARYYVYEDDEPIPAGSVTLEQRPSGPVIADLASKANNSTDYLIVTARPMLAAAAALRDYRADPKRAFPTKPAIVLVEDIYREFSGGRLSPVAIRDFLRLAYHGYGTDADAAGTGSLRHVLFLGDGHYDHRNIKAVGMKDPPPNLVPPYEFITDGGREEVATDDFYAWLDSADSQWDNAAVDLAVGRLPLQNEAQAAAYMAKVKDYEDPTKAGEWRGRVVMTADDATQRNPATNDQDPISRGHTNDTERIGRVIQGREPGVTLDKVYLLDYPMTPSYQKPEASQDLLALINRGTLVVNYVGHGSSNQWADEVLLQTSDALSRMHNAGKTGMINAFSCTVGRFESLSSEGMSEQIVKRPGAGAIAAVSATRESFPLPNIALAMAFYASAFPEDTSTRITTLGEALQRAKVGQSSGSFDNLNNMKYNLLGEPVILLRKPQVRLSLTRYPDTIKALDCNSLQGTVAGGSGNGFVNLKIMAGAVQKTFSVPSGMDPQYAEKRGNILFERTVPYKDGKFSTDYFIPKQISFGDTNASITAFAWDTQREGEGSLAIRDLRIQGTAQSACPADDGRGPTIRVSGCSPKESGGIDFPDQVRLALPYCLQVSVEDSSGGVLTADGPDEGTTLEIPGVIEPFHPQPGLDDLYRKTYQLSLDQRNIRPGTHLFKVSARDGYGNIARRQLRLEVGEDKSLSTFSAHNVPNPLKKGSTVFYFGTVMADTTVEVVEGGNPSPDRLNYEVRIFDQRGRLVKVFRNAISGETRWDGRDEWGNRLGNGVYFYKVIARQTFVPGEDSNPGYATRSTRRNVLVISR